MREIKFRAFYDGRMRYDVQRGDTLGDTFADVLKADVPVMQYTGLHDCNGKEIYEGDIVDCRGGCIETVRWDKFSVCFLPNITNVTEIIGNIYENPELLQK